MEGLSFGEQVKIILSRKNMTIKELAEHIQESTGKPMSRQNLTQRLGRDNFQEQDMRMIAEILGCPFRLSIFPTSPEEDEKIMQYANAATRKKRNRPKQEEETEVYQQTLVFDGKPVLPQEPIVVEERDMTIGELYDIHEELDEMEEKAEQEAEAEAAEKAAEEAREAVPEEVIEEVTEEPLEMVEETYEEVEEPEDVLETAYAEELVEEPVVEEAVESMLEEVVPEAMAEDMTEEPVETVTAAEAEEYDEPAPVQEPVVEEKKEKHHSGGIFLRRMKRTNDDVKKYEPKKEEAKPVEKKPSRPVITPDSEDFEPVIKHVDAEEDLSIGEMNPYTGREYQTNSVRMHPTRIGYVQVYDRSQHQWTDMTEWAFLGYQERKKALLGKDYEPPIYLD